MASERITVCRENVLVPTNIVLVITDNQSPWTLGCYGNEEIRMPSIDRLAGQGIRFTNAFCVNPVCSPNRATLLTGLIPSQHGVHNWLGTEQPDSQMGPDAYSTIREFPTLPRILAEHGYVCGMSGKWHLGDSLHPQLGFTYWYAKPKGHTDSFYNAEAIWRGKVIKERGYYLDAITKHAVEFLSRTEDAPFFLYVGYNAPYGLDGDLRAGHRNRHTEYYADKELRRFPREKAHRWLKQNRDCIGNETAFRSYAAAVSGVDDGVGAIMEALDGIGRNKDTLVIFTADHGFCGGHHGYWGMADHGRPLAMFDENLRVPLIWRHPERIRAGATSDAITCNYDFFPTLLEYLSLSESAPAGRALPGRSLAGALAGGKPDWDDRTTFHEYENTRTARTARWKLTRRFPNGPDELYDLADDPGECQNLIGKAEYDAVRRDLDAQLAAFFARYADARYDLWRGGTSKAGRAVPPSP